VIRSTRPSLSVSLGWASLDVPVMSFGLVAMILQGSTV
jgi:hypothetical protein